MIDTDELDRAFPPGADGPHKADLTRRTLTAVWANLRGAGDLRLILTMVASSIEDELPRIRKAIPGAALILVRLYISGHDLLQRVRRRKVGSPYDYQVSRTIEYAYLMGREPAEDRLAVDTWGRTVGEIA